jgi:hypothetical protein
VYLCYSKKKERKKKMGEKERKNIYKVDLGFQSQLRVTATPETVLYFPC